MRTAASSAAAQSPQPEMCALNAGSGGTSPDATASISSCASAHVMVDSSSSREALAEQALGPVQMRLHGPERDVERRCQRLVLDALQIVRRDQEPVIVGKAVHGLLQPIAQFELAERGVDAGRVDRRPSTARIERLLAR